MDKLFLKKLPTRKVTFLPVFSCFPRTLCIRPAAFCRQPVGEPVPQPIGYGTSTFSRKILLVLCIIGKFPDQNDCFIRFRNKGQSPFRGDRRIILPA
jgi:hypothetical protein